MRSVSIVVPVVDGERFVGETARALLDWLRTCRRRAELVVVDDGSRDGTPRVLCALEERQRGGPVSVRVLTNERNRGKGFAVRRGLLAATGDARIFIDADLTYPAENLERVLAALDQGADLAVADRVHADSRYVVAPDFFRYIYTRHNLGRAFNHLVRLTAVRGLRDTQAGLKGMTADAARTIVPLLAMDGFSFDVELLHAAQRRGARVQAVPVRYVYCKEPSTVQLFRDSVAMARDIARIRARSARGDYDRPAEPRAVDELEPDPAPDRPTTSQ